MSQSFVLELPLAVTPEVEKEFNIRLDAARHLYNACLAEALERLRRVRESQLWYKALNQPKSELRNALFKKALSERKYSEYALHKFAVQTKNACWIGKHLDVHVCQKIATRVFEAVEQYRWGHKGKPRFKPKGWLSSVEGKSNETGIRWREGQVHWKGVVLPAIFDNQDKYAVQSCGLSCKTKYVRLLKRSVKGQSRWYAQLIQEGIPLIKEKNVSPSAEVGLDIGPSSIAVVGKEDAMLTAFCSELEPLQKQMGQIQRKMDRSRRAMNPENYNSDGTLRKGIKLRWQFSHRYGELRSELQECHRVMSSTRKRLHGELSNQILRMGNCIKTEKLSYRSFQKNYGRSVGMRAPGMLIEILSRKAENAGGELIEFSTRRTKLSQVCHGCQMSQKKPLGQRWHSCSCGIGPIQRDLYSAFLAVHVEEDQLDISQAQEAWPGAEPLLWRAVSRLEETTSGKFRLSSFGLSSRRQSGLYAEEESLSSEAMDVVETANGWVLRAKENYSTCP